MPRALSGQFPLASFEGSWGCAPPCSPFHFPIPGGCAARGLPLLNAMMERARSTAERQTINKNGAADPAPQIRRASGKIKTHAERSNPKPAVAQSIKNQIRKTN